jgi:hypothetical protein
MPPFPIEFTSVDVFAQTSGAPSRVAHLGGAPGGLVAQPPERPLADAGVLASPQPLELGTWDGPGAIGWLTAAVKATRRVLSQPAVSAANGNERADRGDMAIPGGGCAVSPG